MVLNAGRYGFVKLQYFNVQFGFDTASIFVDSQSLFDNLWHEWLYTQLLELALGTPMEAMDFNEIFQCLPKEKQKELLDKRIYFAEKTGIKNILAEKTDERQEPSEDLSSHDSLLDILVKTRTVKALDKAVCNSRAYRDTLKQQDKALDRLDNAGLSKEQSIAVNKAISVANDCGATYGAVAYRLGLSDGIRLVSEMKEFT